MKILEKPQNLIILLLSSLLIICSMQIRLADAESNRNSRHPYQQNVFQQTIELDDLEKLVSSSSSSSDDTDETSNEVVAASESKQFAHNSFGSQATVPKIKKFRRDKNRKSSTGGGSSGGIADSATYIRTSIPARIFQCIRKLTIMRCMKLFLLQKMDSKPNFLNSGNLTKDFMEQFFDEDKSYPSLTDKRYKNLSDADLTNRLILHFQKFFKDRDIKLHFIPGVMVQVVPSTENKIKLSVKKNKNAPAPVQENDNDYTDIITGRRQSESVEHNDITNKKVNRLNKKHNYKHTMIQMAVPVLMMPAILLGTFLPFILPAFKMATIMSAILNKGALLAALLYAARTTALNSEAEVVHYAYNHPGYH